MRGKSHLQNKFIHIQCVFNLKQDLYINFFTVKKNYRNQCTRHGIPHSHDYPSLCFPHMVLQLKPVLQTPVSSVQLFSQLMVQENTTDVLTACMEVVFTFASMKKNR